MVMVLMQFGVLTILVMIPTVVPSQDMVFQEDQPVQDLSVLLHTSYFGP